MHAAARTNHSHLSDCPSKTAFGMIFTGLVALLVVLLPGASLPAQVLYGTILGSVADASGAVIPGATVEARDLGTGNVLTTVTNGTGDYTISNVSQGSYQIRITKSGFSTFQEPGLEVLVNSAARVNAVLAIGGSDQIVTVNAQGAVLQTDSADVHTDVSSKQLQDLPQPTRTYEGLVGLAAGVAPPSGGFAGAGGTNNPGRSFIIEANGTSSSGTDVRIDGVSAVNPWVQFYSTAVPSTEAIESVNVVTGTAEAEQGLAGGTQINVQIKSGTNQFHGEAYELYQSSAFNARSYFLSRGTRIPKLVDNDFGGTIGGPFLKNKLFFFASYEGDFLIQGNTTLQTVPTAQERAGDFSALLQGATPQQFFDPTRTATVSNAGGGTTRVKTSPFPNNQIPVSPIAQQLIALLPLPNRPGANGTDANNYLVVTPNQYTLHKLDTKINWNASPKLQIAGRYSMYPYNGTQASTFGDALGGANFHAQSGDTYATTISANYLLSPKVLIDGSWGFTRAHQFLVPPRQNERVGSDVLGIPGTNLGTLPAAGGLPQFNFSGFSNYGYSYPYLEYNDPVFQYAANATVSEGTHSVKFGLNISQQHINHIENNPTAFTFSGGSTAQYGAALNEYNSYADFLLGDVNSRTNSEDLNTVTLRTFEYSVYVRDQWQVTNKLTLSYGTGWELYPVPQRATRGIERYDFATNTYLICGAGGVPSNCGYSVQHTLFTPRFGVAYRPNHSLVVRGGFSITNEQLNMFRDGLYNYPNRLGYSDSATDPYQPVSQVSQGIPVQQAPGNGVGAIPAAQLPGGISFVTAQQNFVRGYVESYNATIQQEFGTGLVGSISYVGTHTIHQHTRYNANASMVLGSSVNGEYFFSLPTGNPDSPILGNTATQTEVLPLEAMTYNSLQASLDRRFSNGLQLHVAYTWSKWFATCCDTSGDGTPLIAIPQYYRLNYTPAPGDIRHNLVLSGIYELPFGAGKPFLNHGIVAKVAGGWQINTLLSLHTGTPFSVLADGTGNINAPGNTQRADLVAPIRKTNAHDGVTPYLNRSSFADVPSGALRFGSSGFDNVYGPGYGDFDFSLFRGFALTERARLQLRTDVLNITNHPNFLNPSFNGNANQTSIDDSGFGIINSVNPGSRTQAERYLRLGAKITF